MARFGRVQSRSFGRTSSSNRWLNRARNDPYSRGDHRSRAYFKLEQIDARCSLFDSVRRVQKGRCVVLDIGCAPGGWTEYALSRLGDDGSFCVGVDLLPVEMIPGSVVLMGDVRDASVRSQMRASTLGLPVLLVMSDIAPNTTGDGATDHFRSLDLAALSLAIAEETLDEGGAFLCKLFRGRDDRELVEGAKDAGFQKVQWVKPKASRAESKEAYFLATGFRSSAN